MDALPVSLVLTGCQRPRTSLSFSSLISTPLNVAEEASATTPLASATASLDTLALTATLSLLLFKTARKKSSKKEYLLIFFSSWCKKKKSVRKLKFIY